MFRKSIVFIIVFSLLFCVACAQNESARTEVTEYATTQAPTETTQAPTEAEETHAVILSPIDPDAPVVEVYTNELTFGNPPYTYRCSIPQIQSESTYAEAINQELSDYYNTYLQDDGAWHGGNVSYNWYINADILTLVVYFYNTEAPLDSEVDFRHLVCNLRMSDGSEVTADEILQMFGVSEEDFRARAKQILGNSYLLMGLPDAAWQSILEDPEGNADHYALEQFIATVSDDCLDHLIPFLAEDGTLRFIGRVYYIAGGFDYKTPIFSYFDDFEVSPYYEDMLKLCSS